MRVLLTTWLWSITNPHTGRSVMDTIAAWIQMLRPGVHTKAHRQVNSSVYHVFEGRGASQLLPVSASNGKSERFSS